MCALRIVAVDLGAESGRVILGDFDGEHIITREVHRFLNRPVLVHGTLFWDVLSLFAEVQDGLARAADIAGQPILSVGVDSWGVDFALLDRLGQLLGNPVHYRDQRTAGMLEYVHQRISPEEIYQRTGIQFLRINTLYQLAALAVREDPQLMQAQTFLMIPDLFHYWLTGTIACEYTNATTTQCYDPRRQEWVTDLLEVLGVPTAIFPTVISPGTLLGPLLPEIAERTGMSEASVVAPATHDTGSAVAAVPFIRAEAAFISSGTWSLIGMESQRPLINPQARDANLTNEGGVAGTFRILKNVMGLWLLQECRRIWLRQGKVWDYSSLTKLAETAPPLATFIDPDDERFLLPENMPAQIQAFCHETGQVVPESPAAIVRCVLESLVLKYRWNIEHLEALSGRPIHVIHIVGGGARNQLLCQWTANATKRLVLAGPVEATALGNLCIQLMAHREIGSLAEIRELIRHSMPIYSYTPQNGLAWDAAYERFQRLLRKP